MTTEKLYPHQRGASVTAFGLIIVGTWAPLLLSTAAPVRFTDVAREWGITFRHENGASAEKIMVETFGSGVAAFDYDNDGRVDLFFANGANLVAGTPSPGNALYRNAGRGRFVDVTARAHVRGNGRFATGVAVGDVDNDGWADLFVAGYGGNLLYRNNRDGTFADLTASAGVGGGGWSSRAGFLDFDRDGDLDLYVTRYLDYDARRDPHCGHRRPGCPIGMTDPHARL